MVTAPVSAMRPEEHVGNFPRRLSNERDRRRMGRVIMTSKQALVGLVLGAAAAILGPMASPVSADTVKIGFITSYSGFLAQAGDSMDKGVALYLKTHQADLPPGVQIELIKRDDTSSNADVGKRLAQELITRDHVQILAGVVGSPIAAAIAPLTAEAKVPLVIMNAAGSAIPRISPYLVRVSFTIWQQAYPMGKWAARQGWKKGYTAVSDFIPGHDGEAGFAKGFTDAGGEMVGAVQFPPANPDFAPFVQRIKDAKPDVVFVFVPGGKQATGFMKAWADLGLTAAGVTLVGTQDVVTDDELPNMGEAPLGIVTAGIYSVAGKRPQNAAFLAAWSKEYGDTVIPNYIAVGGWDGMAAIFDVIKQTKGSFDGDQAMAILKTWKNPDSPRGPIEIDPTTRDIVQTVYIRRVERESGRLANVEFDSTPRVKDPWKELNPPK
jgi:branched-chain amino acid transport system substrate-binding protein